MPAKSNQHFVPQFYFRYFSLDGRSICLLKRIDGKTIRNASIKGQASKRYFYGDASTEDLLATADGASSRVLGRLRKVGDFDDLSLEERYEFLQILMLQKARTATARTRSKPMQNKLLRMHLEMDIGNDKKLSDEEKEKFLGILNKVEANPKRFQAMEMAAAVEAAVHLADLSVLILANKTNRPFIFSDAPVVWINLFYKRITLRGVLGAATPGLLVFYPLDAHNQVLLFDSRVYRVKGGICAVRKIRSLRDVAAMNKLQIHNASLAVYFSNYMHASYVEELWRQERQHLRGNEGKVLEAPGYDETGASMGDIVHSFTPQLPYLPEFTFLRYDAIDESEYQFSSRAEYA